MVSIWGVYSRRVREWGQEKELVKGNIGENHVLKIFLMLSDFRLNHSLKQKNSLESGRGKHVKINHLLFH